MENDMATAGSAPLIAPSADWRGTAGSGFSYVPFDPVRTTAKPAIRLLTPPNQYYTDFLTIGVFAGANNAGSLYDNFGLEMVIVHYEGTRTFISEPACQSFHDANGNPVSYFGWWAKLRHDGRNGHGHIYFEAVPKDCRMQRRIIGPYHFSPQAAFHDQELTVAATGQIVIGSSYRTLASALDWCRANGRHNPLITVVEGGTYDLGTIDSVYQGRGYATITATLPITISRPPQASAPSRFYRPRYAGIQFYGRNVTVDFCNADEFYAENDLTTVNRPTWFNGCVLTNSNGRYDLYHRAPRNALAALVRGGPIFTEAAITYLYNAACGARLIRGCTFRDCWGDLANGADICIANRIDELDSTIYRKEIPSLTVSYSGSHTTATLGVSGTHNQIRTFTAKYGSTTATFTVNGTEGAFTANTNYTIENVADWLNSLPGWKATVLDNSRRANLLCLTDTAGTSFSDVNLKNTSLTLVTMIDVHADFAQTYKKENYIISDNVVTNSVCQNIFLKDGYSRDALIVNNAFHNKAIDGQYSQLAATHSHVVIAHNSLSKQNIIIRTDFIGAEGSTSERYKSDRFCMIANNVLPKLIWAKTVDPNLRIANNHLFGGASTPVGSTGTTIGGLSMDLFEDAAVGDFTPTDILLANAKPAVLRRHSNAPAMAEMRAPGYLDLD